MKDERTGEIAMVRFATPSCGSCLTAGQQTQLDRRGALGATAKACYIRSPEGPDHRAVPEALKLACFNGEPRYQ